MKLKVSEIFNRLQKSNPKPTTELQYNTPFELLIAVILSAQTTDIMVNKVTKKLFLVANTPEQIVSLGEKNLINYIKSIGLYNSKAANIINSCKILVKQFNSMVPDSREELESLPGVGRKTANVILNTIWNQATVAVDTHVFRVSNRIGIVKTKTLLATELELLKIIPKKFLINAHHWLILHGRYICTARKPKCTECLIADLCQSYKEYKKHGK
jgi:endonuclease III